MFLFLSSLYYLSNTNLPFLDKNFLKLISISLSLRQYYIIFLLNSARRQIPAGGQGPRECGANAPERQGRAGQVQEVQAGGIQAGVREGDRERQARGAHRLGGGGERGQDHARVGLRGPALRGARGRAAAHARLRQAVARHLQGAEEAASQVCHSGECSAHMFTLLTLTHWPILWRYRIAIIVTRVTIRIRFTIDKVISPIKTYYY